MPHTLALLALDLGAESGRAMLGKFDGERVALAEIHRFPNEPVQLPTGLHWDVLRLWTEIKRGLALVARNAPGGLAGIGVDAWGNDFALLSRDGKLLEAPYHYRDARTDGMMEDAFRRVGRRTIFEQTGIQMMPINGLYQLLSLANNRSPLFDVAENFLTIPDLFNYWLCGRKACEFTNATTTQCYDPRRGDWAWPLLNALAIPTRMFGEIMPPGIVLGPLQSSVRDEVGLGPVPVVTPACHDTGSAVAAVPADTADFAWISSGTWSIMGAEVGAPVIDEQSLTFDMTNEGGVAGTFRYCKNIMGLWLVQECRRTWARAGMEWSYAQLTEMAAAASPFNVIVDPDCREFLKPGDMPARVAAYCRRTGQSEPADRGSLIRSLLEGVALKYRVVLERLESALGKRLSPIHIVGGGANNRLLCQFTADATGRPVVAGPTEASALGNVLVQALALGRLGSLIEARAVVRRSSGLAFFEPADRARWDEAYGRLKEQLTA
jgi:rhamnulokinase